MIEFLLYKDSNQPPSQVISHICTVWVFYDWLCLVLKISECITHLPLYLYMDFFGRGQLFFSKYSPAFEKDGFFFPLKGLT